MEPALINAGSKRHQGQFCNLKMLQTERYSNYGYA